MGRAQKLLAAAIKASRATCPAASLSPGVLLATLQASCCLINSIDRESRLSIDSIDNWEKGNRWLIDVHQFE